MSKRNRSGIWGAGTRLAMLVIAGSIGAIVLAGCTKVADPTPIPSPGTTINCTATDGGTITNCGTGNGNVTNPNPSPSPSPNDTFICADAHAFIASFGWTGPTSSVRPNNQVQPYTLCKDCTSMLTGTLKKPTGDAPLNESSGRGRPEWTVDPIGVVDITTDPAQTNNVDGYNLLVKPTAAVGSTATVKLKFNASCSGDPVKGEFKYVITAN